MTLSLSFGIVSFSGTERITIQFAIGCTSQVLSVDSENTMCNLELHKSNLTIRSVFGYNK